MATPHNTAQRGDFAKTVLMPGDPLRAKFIAETYLDDPVLVNNVRGNYGYTGTFMGKRVSVMATGMGMPSLGIYVNELYQFYDVECIIRVGSAGAIHPDLQLYDVVLAMGSCHDANLDRQYGTPGTFAPIADFGLLQKGAAALEQLGARYRVGNIVSSDVFYDPRGAWKKWREFGALCVEGKEMSSESFSALFTERENSGKPKVCFLIGGSWGMSETVKARADLKLSMSKMTFPHHLARVMLVEQIYRAFKIAEGSRYHK